MIALLLLTKSALLLLALGASVSHMVGAKRFAAACLRYGVALFLLMLIGPALVRGFGARLGEHELVLDPGTVGFLGVALVGHVVFGVWLLQRRARRDVRERRERERESASRRSRPRLPDVGDLS